MLNTDSEFLRQEIMDVLRIFCAEDEDFLHSFKVDGNDFHNKIIYENKEYNFVNRGIYGGELEFKRLAKRYSKLAFYNLLKNAKNVSMPWGALTGIRPTKLAYGELARGGSVEKLFKEMDVKDPNISLIERVLEAQKPAYLKGGQDLYISIPFCPTKCEYCSFITAPVAATGKYIKTYVDCLVKEINSIAPYLKNLRSIYVGGGTPFVLDESELTRIYAAIKPLLKVGIEYTVEAGRPDTFTRSKLELSKSYGVNRLCVNPQTFSNATLERIGRKHTAEQTIQAYALAREVGFDINLDLICGLTGERCANFENSLNTAISLKPENITVHTLSLKSGAKLKEKVERLSGEEVGDMIALSREKLTAAGYEPYYLYRQKYQAGGHENTGWCLKGKVSRYNVGVMEEISDNIALGAGGVSKRVFAENERIERYAAPKDIPSYIAKVDRIIEERNKFYSFDK